MAFFIYFTQFFSPFLLFVGGPWSIGRRNCFAKKREWFLLLFFVFINFIFGRVKVDEAAADDDERRGRKTNKKNKKKKEKVEDERRA